RDGVHVQPMTYPHERRGIVELGYPVFDDFCSWEMLGHALSVAKTINSLLSQVAADLASDEELEARLLKLTHAHKQTLEYNEIMMALAATARSRNKTESSQLLSRQLSFPMSSSGKWSNGFSSRNTPYWK